MDSMFRGAIWAMYYAQTKKTQKKVRFQEGFEGTSDVVKDFLKERGLSDALFSKSTAENPLQNVLLTDYDNPTDKRPAPASCSNSGWSRFHPVLLSQSTCIFPIS